MPVADRPVSWASSMSRVIALRAWIERGRRHPVLGPLLIILLVLVLVLIAMCVVVPWLAARTVAGERETGELLALQIGPSRPLTIAVAKTGTVFAQFLVLFFVAVPFLTFAHLLGGVTPRELLRGTAMILAFALALSAWCVALASYTQRASTATIAGYGVVAVLVLGTVLAFAIQGAVRRTGKTERLNHAVLFANPFVATADAVAGRSGGDERFPSPFTPFLAMMGDRITIIDQIRLIDDSGAFFRNQGGGRIPRRRHVRVWKQSMWVTAVLTLSGLAVATRGLRLPKRIRFGWSAP